MEALKILVVEDDSAIAETIQVNLESAGYQVTVTDDGLKALQLFESGRPDLLTVDLGLPTISGFRLVELVKSSRVAPPVPVIVVTALDFEESEEVARAGADEFITKPLDPEDLLAKVEYLLGRSKCDRG